MEKYSNTGDQPGTTTLNTEPLDIFGADTNFGSVALPKDSLPKIIDDFAHDQAERLGVDPGLIALPALVAAAAAAPDSITLRVKRHDDWVESARLWVAVVADPGSKKTPAINRAVKPIKDLDQEFTLEDGPAHSEWKLEMKYWTKLEAKAMTAGAKNGRSLEEVLADIPPVPGPEPVLRRKVVTDTTTEKLGVILAANVEGLLLAYDELSGWIGGMDAYHGKGGKDRGFWLEAWGGGSYRVDRQNRPDLIIPNASMSIVGGIQPARLRKMKLDMQDDGLLQRFIVVFGGHEVEEVDRKPNETIGKAYTDAVNELVDLPGAKSVPVHYSAGAQLVQDRVFKLTNAFINDPQSPPAFKEHMRKWQGMFARLALTFHLIENVGGEDRDVMADVSADTAECAYRLFQGYLLPHAIRFYEEVLSVGDTVLNARWIAGHILAHKLTEITARDIGRAYRKVRGPGTAIQEAMTVLEQSFWVEPIEPRGGRPVKKWKVSPEVHDIFAKRAEAEKKHREAEMAKIAEAAKMRRELKAAA